MPRIKNHNPVLHYQRVGEGETIVFIHGLGANLAFWFLSIGRLLARDYSIITYDLRGHGRSGMTPHGYLLNNMVEDLSTLLEYLEVQRAHIVGHSFGARVALAQTILKPSTVASLTIADTQAKCLQPPTRLRDWPHWPRWKRDLLAQGHVGLPDEDEVITFELLSNFNEIATGFTHGDLAKRGKAAGTPSLKRRDMGKKGAARWTQLMRETTARREFADEKPLSETAIAQIRVPTLAMFGEFSHCLPTCRRLKQLIPDCEVSIVPGAGHFHPAVKPRRFVRQLTGFLRRNQRMGARSMAAGG